MEDDKRHFDDSSSPVSGGFSGWKRGVAIGAAALAVFAGIGLAAARSNEPGGFMGGHFMHARMGGMGFMESRIGHVLDEIDATSEQEEKLWTIIDEARGEMRPMTRDFRDTREAVVELLASPTLDRAAAEKLRSERIAAIDEASKKMTTAILDAAEVLTPEQRTKLVEHFKERRSHRRWQ